MLTQKAGWTVGAGLEGRLFGNVTGKVEYLYMNFGNISRIPSMGLNATPITLAVSSRITDNIVRAGVNYKFNPASGGYDGLPGIGIPLIYKAPPYKAPPYGPPIATAWSWAGPYVGVNVGYSPGRSKTFTTFSDASAGTPLFAAGSSESLDGLIGGFQGGYNWMASNWVVAGIEADIQLSTQNTTPTFICPGAILQSDHRRPRAGGREPRPRAKIGLVRHGARPPRRHSHARYHDLSHRRVGRR